MKKLIFCVLVAFSVSARGGGHQHTATASNPQFEKLKALVGSWEGKTKDHDNKELASKTSFRLVSGNSVLMNILDEGAPHEMVTMVHPDGEDLYAVHYCAAQNVPRLKAIPNTKPNQFTFEFKDGANIAAGAGHMQRVTFTLVDATHHTQDWTFLDKGKESTKHFEYTKQK